MKSFDSRESKSFSYFTAGIISLALHLAVAGVLVAFSKLAPEPPPPPMIVTMLAEPQPPVPPTHTPPVPEPPIPEPPAPEPPAPEPPKPEPPKPEPPKPEPPKPEPPKPVSEPPKPPKPEPVKVKEPVKPKPPPVPSVAERFRNAEVKTSQPVPPKPVSRPASNPDDIRRRLTQGVLQQRVTTSSAYQSSANLTSEQRIAAAEAVDYANQVANPFISPLWQELGPGKGELGNQLPNPVKVEFTVLEDGKVVGARITQRSNSEAMNQAVERLLVRLRRERMPSLPSVGVKSKSLSIVMFLETRS